MDTSFLKQLTSRQLRRAAELRDKIESMESELTTMLHIPPQLTVGNVMRRKRKMSAAAKKRIADAARARWAKWRADKKG